MREEVVDRSGLHLGHHLVRVIRARGLDGLEVVHELRIDACLNHRRHLLVALEEALRPLAAGVVAIPIERRRQVHPLRRGEAEAVYIREKDEQTSQALFRSDSEFIGLLDGVDRVGAGVGEPDDLGAGRLRLQQVGREVGGGERRFDAAHDLAAGLGDDFGRIRFERLAEHIIRGNEVPGLAALLHDRPSGACRHRVGVVGVVDVVGRALLAGDRRGAGAGEEGDALLLGGDGHDGQRGGARHQVGDGVDLLFIEPLAGDARRDIRLVLVVGADDDDRLAEDLTAEVLRRHLCGNERPRPGEIRVGTGHVGKDSDLHDVVGHLSEGRRGDENENTAQDNVAKPTSHGSSYCVCVAQTPRNR